MYLIKLQPEMVAELYRLREAMKEEGEKTTIAELVREAVREKLQLIGLERGYCQHWKPVPVCEFCRQEKVEKNKKIKKNFPKEALF